MDDDNGSHIFEDQWDHCQSSQVDQTSLARTATHMPPISLKTQLSKKIRLPPFMAQVFSFLFLSHSDLTSKWLFFEMCKFYAGSSKLHICSHSPQVILVNWKCSCHNGYPIIADYIWEAGKKSYIFDCYIDLLICLGKSDSNRWYLSIVSPIRPIHFTIDCTFQQRVHLYFTHNR